MKPTDVDGPMLERKPSNESGPIEFVKPTIEV